MYTILLIVLFGLIAWYFFWYVVREIYTNHIYNKYINSENDDSVVQKELLYNVYVVKELPKPSDDTMEKLYVLIEEEDTTQVWVTLHHPEKHVYAWCPISNVSFCDEISDLIF